MAAWIDSPTPPSSPIIGDGWHNTVNNRRYVWTMDARGKGAWFQEPTRPVSVAPPIPSTYSAVVLSDAVPITNLTPKHTLADVPPPAPEVGDFWWDTTRGFLFTWYDDGSTTQWVVSNPGMGSEEGPPGQTGDTGPQGEKGDPGAPGVTGPQGPPGAQGMPGTPGADSTVPGPQGPPGATGPVGPVGPQGERGPVGPQGLIGPMGPKGDKGDTGNTGATGPQGIQGPVGPQGIQGVKGDTGATGPTGPQGIQGIQGEVGPVGPPGPTDWDLITDKPDFDATYVNVAGDTMTGDLNVGTITGTLGGTGSWISTLGWFSIYSDEPGWAGFDMVLTSNPVDKKRWQMQVVPTSGDFTFWAVNDAYNDGIEITMHQTGGMTLPGPLTGTAATLSTAIPAGENSTRAATTAWVTAKDYAPSASLGNYLPLAGGRLTGELIVGGPTLGSVRLLPSGDAGHAGLMGLYNGAGVRGAYIGYAYPIIQYSAEAAGSYHDFYAPNNTRFSIVNNGTSYFGATSGYTTVKTPAVAGSGNALVLPTASGTIALTSDITAALTSYQPTAAKGAANGYAPLDASSKVPAINLPAYVDDVLEFANLAAFPGTGSTGVIYVALDTNKVYRWSGSVYTEISPSPGTTDAVPEGASNLYFTNERVDDRAAALIVAGTNIIKTYDDTANTLTISTTAYPTGLPPTGTASGDLAGTYPAPTIKSNVALAGAPTTTTAATADSSTLIATTAFVKAQGYQTVTGGNAVYAPISHTHAPANITPGTNTQVLTTVGGVSAWATPTAGGSVTAVSVVSANGLAGTVATPNTTPAITLSTSVTGMLKGNGTAISAAVAGTDYMTPANVTTALGAYLPLAGGTVTGDTTFGSGNRGAQFDLTGGDLTNFNLRYDDNLLAYPLQIRNYGITAINQGAAINFQYGNTPTTTEQAGAIGIITTDTWAAAANRKSQLVVYLNNGAGPTTALTLSGTTGLGINNTITGTTEPAAENSTKLASTAWVTAKGYQTITGGNAAYAPAVHTHSYLPLAGGTLTGALTGTQAVFNAGASTPALRATGNDAVLLGLFSGTTKGLRIITNSTGSNIEGVDSTGVGSYQPLTLNGTTVSAPTVSPATDSTTKIATTAFVQAAIANIVPSTGGTLPTGAIIDYAGYSAPAGWLMCQGQAVSRTTYAALFAVLSTGYGSGDGSTTFNVPDLGGRVTAGLEAVSTRLTMAGSGIDGASLGMAGGTQTHALLDTQNAGHSHAYTDPGHGNAHNPAGHMHTSNIGGGTTWLSANSGQGYWCAVGGAGGPNPVYYTGETTWTADTSWNATGYAGITIGVSGSAVAHQNTQPTIIMRKIIKT